MAIGMVPNPKKSIIIDFSVKEISDAIVKIPSQFDKTYTLDSRNDVLHQFTFSALEFLSLGVFIDVTANYVTDNKTSVEIEVRRKIGVFDQTFEVEKAHRHIQKILNGIAALLTKQKKYAETVETSNPVQMITINLPIDDFKRHLQTLLKTYATIYNELPDYSAECVTVLKRKSLKADVPYDEHDAILKFYALATSENECQIKIEITNSENKIATVGELDRNKVILQITIKLINKIITDLETSIESAEKELANAQKWKVGRSEAAKQQQVDTQLLLIESLKRQLRQNLK